VKKRTVEPWKAAANLIVTDVERSVAFCVGRAIGG
jgi:hypothetical protein